ncbi:hypothetical protein [Gluconobacter cerinus]|uniref:hypothetical protein n=1 Tax=Gluconobacter cerinus TaxID=38307 RepID=UPI001B8BDA70|nr:hypothetical protein [Gluconobacter cerinus]MBS0983496.1 hypothetical protein [Gluconobacter cerinus]
MRKKKYTVEDLNEQFMDIYNYIVVDTVIDNDEGNGLYPDEENNHYVILGKESLLTLHRYAKQQLRDQLSNAIEMYKSDEYNDEFPREIGRIGGQIGGLKRKFIQECKIYVIHKLFPESKFSGNVLIEISEKLFGKGINRSFLHGEGHALGPDGLFSGKSDIVSDISDEQQKQSRILMDILKRMA